jgi:hypothetical protein
LYPSPNIIKSQSNRRKLKSCDIGYGKYLTCKKFRVSKPYGKTLPVEQHVNRRILLKWISQKYSVEDGVGPGKFWRESCRQVNKSR